MITIGYISFHPRRHWPTYRSWIIHCHSFIGRRLYRAIVNSNHTLASLTQKRTHVTLHTYKPLKSVSLYVHIYSYYVCRRHIMRKLRFRPFAHIWYVKLYIICFLSIRWVNVSKREKRNEWKWGREKERKSEVVYESRVNESKKKRNIYRMYEREQMNK